MSCRYVSYTYDQEITGKSKEWERGNFQRVMFGRAESLEIKDFRLRKIYMTLIVCGQMMKEMTKECLHPITKPH